jgi:glycosyltransferase involved in cell wall biosynthesis
VRVTGGIYYQYEFAYPTRARRYCAEVMARHFAFHAGAGRVVFFGEAARAGIAARTGLDLASCPLLPIGIDLKRAQRRDSARARRTKAVSVGRLTDIKTYNLYFLDAVAALRRRGVDFEYHVWGDGPALERVRRRIDELGLSAHVHLHGNLEYSRFGETIADAGLFVGSGTALIEAAACGVPALIGIESEPDDLSYGYLHEMPGLAYHEQGIARPKTPFAGHVERLLALDDAAYDAMGEASARKAAEYSIERLVDGWMDMDRRIAAAAGAGPAPAYSRSRFIASLLLDRLAAAFGRGSGFWSRYDRSAEAGR